MSIDSTSQPASISIALLTLIVAFCSLVYELIYSQTLTILFGQTVVRYSVTIGLYLFSLGIGAFLFSRVAKLRARGVFYAVEIALSVLGPLGVFGVFFINSTTRDAWLEPNGQLFLLVVSHLPVVIVGLLSGLELPLLTALSAEPEGAFHRVLG